MTHDTILSTCTSGGCGAKIGPGALAGLLGGLPRQTDERLLIGFDGSDDAAVYALDDENCLISTVDFFSPMVEDPKTFGRIAAANALSDVYAMGGKPVLALNLICFPEKLPPEWLAEILQGGAEKIAEAGASLGGGHSIYDKETKYGLAVTGLVKQAHLLRNNTPKIGHSLILTKPLGVGVVLAAARANEADAAHVAAATASMARLNRYAAEKMVPNTVSACTDITGFGLFNHLLELCGGAVSALLDPAAFPLLPGAKAYADGFFLTAAGQRNRNFFGANAAVETLPFALQELCFDPQTSGGLLICVSEAEAPRLLSEIQADDSAARIIGQIVPRAEKPLLFVPQRSESVWN